MASGEKQEERAAPDTAPARVRPLLDRYCIGCHGAEKAKGGIRLDLLSEQIDQGRDFETWLAVYQHLRNGAMPPEDESQPDELERSEAVDWIGAELLQASASGRVQYLIGQFAASPRWATPSGMVPLS